MGAGRFIIPYLEPEKYYDSCRSNENKKRQAREDIVNDTMSQLT